MARRLWNVDDSAVYRVKIGENGSSQGPYATVGAARGRLAWLRKTYAIRRSWDDPRAPVPPPPEFKLQRAVTAWEDVDES